MASETSDWSAITRRGSLGLAASMVAAVSAGKTAARSSGREWSSLDAIGARSVADRLTPGIQMSVMRDGRLVYSKAFGTANLETATPMVPVSVLRIGSLTKQFTAAALLLLQEDGKLSVDDRLSRFVPEIAPAAQISLRQMLGHVSGIAISPVGPLERVGTQAMEHDAASMVRVIGARNPILRTPPGAHWEYNNLAFRLLGVVVERAAGRPYGEFVRARLLEPAGLTRTAVDKVAEIVRGRAAGYDVGEGKPDRFRNAVFLSPTWPSGGGAMRSTTDDLCRWHDALLGGRLLRAPSLAAMLTPVRLNDGSLAAIETDADTAAAYGTLRYGMGIAMGNKAGRPLVTHTGSINGFLSQLTSYPGQRVSVAVMINSGRVDEGREGANEKALRTAVQEAARIALG